MSSLGDDADWHEQLNWTENKHLELLGELSVGHFGKHGKLWLMPRGNKITFTTKVNGSNKVHCTLYSAETPYHHILDETRHEGSM